MLDMWNCNIYTNVVRVKNRIYTAPDGETQFVFYLAKLKNSYYAESGQKADETSAVRTTRRLLSLLQQCKHLFPDIRTKTDILSHDVDVGETASKKTGSWEAEALARRNSVLAGKGLEFFVYPGAQAKWKELYVYGLSKVESCIQERLVPDTRDRELYWQTGWYEVCVRVRAVEGSWEEPWTYSYLTQIQFIFV